MRGSGFSGIVQLHVEQGVATVTGTRSHSGGGGMLSVAQVLLVFGLIGLVAGLFVAGGATSDSDMGLAFSCMGPGLLFLLIGLPLFFIGRSRATRGNVESMQFRLADARIDRVRYDANVGCLWAIILSPNLEEFGVGYAISANSSFGHYWTVDLGKRAA